MTTEKNMLDALIQHQVYTYRTGTAVVNELNSEFAKSTNSFANKLRDLLDDLTDAEKEALTLGRYTTDTLKEVKQAFDDWYSVVYTQLPETFAVSAASLAAYEAGYISKLYGDSVDISGDKIFNKAKKQPIVGGRLYDDVWKSLATSTREKALYAVREGIQNGLTTAQIVNEIRGTRTKVGDKYEYVGGIVEQAKHQIEASVRTIRSHVANTSYDEVFDVLGAEYFKYFATIDFRTTKLCGSLDGTLWKKGDPSIRRPPLHYGCRSVLLMVDKEGTLAGKRPFVRSDKPVSKMSKDEREGNIGQIDANESFSTWLARQPKHFQEEYLGKTKFKLYSEGNYNLSKFVDPLGKEYTISELRALDEKTFKELNL